MVVYVDRLRPNNVSSARKKLEIPLDRPACTVIHYVSHVHVKCVMVRCKTIVSSASYGIWWLICFDEFH